MKNKLLLSSRILVAVFIAYILTPQLYLLTSIATSLASPVFLFTCKHII